MAKESGKTQKPQNSSGPEQKKKKKHTLKKIYTADESIEDFKPEPAEVVATENIIKEAAEDPLLKTRSIFLEDKLQYKPGAGYVLTQEPPSLSCSGLDPDTHEIWLLQLPSDWKLKAPARIAVKRRKGHSLLGECTSETGDRFSLVQEHASLAAPLFVASSTLKDGVPVQIHRRVTLVRSSGSVGKVETEMPSAQQPATEPPSKVNGDTPKRKKAKAEQEGTKELRLEDIVVKQESPDGKGQKEKKKKKKKDKGDPAGTGHAMS